MVFLIWPQGCGIDYQFTLHFVILGNCEGRLKLKSNHNYYHQIQGQLHMTGTSCCDLIVWTPKDMVIVRIAKDCSWECNIQKLVDYYFEVFIDTLQCDHEKN